MIKHLLLLGLLLQACTPAPAPSSDAAPPKLFFPGGGMPLPASPGALAEYNGTAWVVLDAGPSGQFVQSIGSALRYTSVSPYTGIITSPPLAATWTDINWPDGGTTSAIDYGANTLLPGIFFSDTTANTSAIRIIRMPIVGSDGGPSSGIAYTLTTAIMPLFQIQSNPIAGILISDGTKLELFCNETVSGQNIETVQTWSTATTFTAFVYGSASTVNTTFASNGFIWYQIKSDLTHRFYNVSVDGINFTPRFTETISSSTMNNTEAYIGFFVAEEGSATKSAASLISWTQTSP